MPATTAQVRSSTAADTAPWHMLTLEPVTPLSTLTDLAEMCEEAADEMLECDGPSEVSECARDYLDKHIMRLADDVYLICPNTLFGGEPIVVECRGHNATGPVLRPVRSLHSLVTYAVREINIDYGAACDISEDFADAAFIVRAVIARVEGVAA